MAGRVYFFLSSKIDYFREILTIGWGITEKGYVSVNLMQVSIPVNNDQICSNKLEVYDPSTQVCAGDINNLKDSCQGDSGGPLMKKINGSWTLVGIVSYGDSYCCGFGVYTKVIEYYDWIIKNKW